MSFSFEKVGISSSMILLNVIKKNGIPSACQISVPEQAITTAVFVDQVSGNTIVTIQQNNSYAPAVLNQIVPADNYEVSDSLTTILNQSEDLFSATITSRTVNGVPETISPSQQFLFYKSNVVGSVSNLGYGSRFLYREQSAVLSEYISSNSPSQISSGSGSGPEPFVISVPFLATQNILKHQVVTASGQVADSSSVNQRDRILGIAEADVSAGFIGNAITEGIVQDSSFTFTVGLPIFLNGVSLSNTPPASGFSMILGVVTRVDKINVSLRRSVLL